MSLAELAIKKALSKGATEAEIYVQRRKTVQVEFAEEIESFKTIESLGMALMVALGKKIAMYSTSVLDEDEVSEAAERAVKIARVSKEDPHWRHVNRKFGRASAEGYYDEKLKDLEYEEIIETLTSVVKWMKDYDRRVVPTRGILSISTSKILIANSYGDECERKETNIAVWVRAKAEEADMKGTGTEHQESRFWKGINFQDLALRTAEKAVKFLRAKPMPGGKLPVIIRNQVFADILGVILSGPINADWVQKGRSPLSNKLGSQIALDNVTIFDDGTMGGGWRTRPFDDEGHPTQRTAIIEKGILKSYLYDTYTALKEGLESTGNAFRRRYWMPPQPSPSNLILKPRRASPEEMIRETRKGIYIEGTIGEWLSNPVSGNINATVTHGYLVENGEIKKPVKGVIISGNFYELLKGGIEIIGEDLRNSGGNYSPTVKIAELTIAGK